MTKSLASEQLALHQVLVLHLLLAGRADGLYDVFLLHCWVHPPGAEWVSTRGLGNRKLRSRGQVTVTYTADLLEKDSWLCNRLYAPNI